MAISAGIATASSVPCAERILLIRTSLHAFPIKSCILILSPLHHIEVTPLIFSLVSRGFESRQRPLFFKFIHSQGVGSNPTDANLFFFEII